MMFRASARFPSYKGGVFDYASYWCFDFRRRLPGNECRRHGGGEVCPLLWLQKRRLQVEILWLIRHQAQYPAVSLSKTAHMFQQRRQ